MRAIYEGKQLINRSILNQSENTLYRSLLIVMALVGAGLGGYWLPQGGWGLPILFGVWGGAILLGLSLRRRSRPAGCAADEPAHLVNSRQDPVLTQGVATRSDQSILQLGFYLCLASFAIGWRQLWITSVFKIHPTEAIIWALLALLLVQRKPLSSPIPASIKAFLALGGVGLLSSLSRGITWEVSLNEFKMFLVIIPIIYIIHATIQTPSHWRITFLIIALVTFYVSLLGLVEYFVPSLIAPLRGTFFAEQGILYSQQGFARADFTFWGGSIINVYLAMILVPIFSSAMVERHPIWRLFLLLTTVLCGLGVYVAGGRGSWLAAVGALFLYTLLSSKLGWLKFLLLLVVSYHAALYVLPDEVYNNIYAAFDPQDYYDTSALVRQARAEVALELIKQNPLLGHGWGASGWVHNDLLQIGANLGLPALLVLLSWYLSRIWRLYTLPAAPPNWPDGQVYRRGLIAGLAVGLFSLSTQAIIVLPHLIIPLWFLVVLAERLPILLKSPVLKKGNS